MIFLKLIKVKFEMIHMYMLINKDVEYETIFATTTLEKTIFLNDDELLPEHGLFRLRIQIYDEFERGSAEDRATNHDLTAEFTIE